MCSLFRKRRYSSFLSCCSRKVFLIFYAFQLSAYIGLIFCIYVWRGANSRRPKKSLSRSKFVRMRMSCNGCRILRKGCSESCILRPCLEWIRSAEAQANATVFLAKFYGRSGLMKLLNAGPNHLRPVIFRSLLYEACGRIINPVYGSVGLQWTKNWDSCQAAVEGVLKGHPLQMKGPPEPSLTSDCSDIKPSPSRLFDSILTERPLKLKNKSRFKRSLRRKPTAHLEKLDVTTDSQVCNFKCPNSCQKEFESMFHVAQEENHKAWNNNKIMTYTIQGVVKEEANVELEQVQEEMGKKEAIEEMFHHREMEILSDNNYCKETNENDVELELRLGSPVSYEAVETLQDLKLSHRHYNSQNGCKDHPLPNFTSLNLALS